MLTHWYCLVLGLREGTAPNVSLQEKTLTAESLIKYPAFERLISLAVLL